MSGEKKEEKMDRRKYIKYVGAGAVVAAAAAAIGYGVSELTKPPPPKPTTIVTTVPTPTTIVTTVVPPPTTVVTTVPTVTTVAKKILKLAHYYDPGVLHLREGLEKWIYPCAKEFEAKFPEWEIHYEYYKWDDIDPRMIIDYKAGIPHDVAFLSPQYIGRHIKEGSLLDLTGYIKGWEAKDFDWSAVWKGCYPYMVPNGLHTRTVVYRMDMFEEVGLDPNKPPKDLDEFVEYAKKLTRDTDGDGKIDVWGLAFEVGPDRATVELFFAPLLWHFGGELWDPKTKKATFAEEPGVKAAQFIYDLYWKHKVVNPATLGLDYTSAIYDIFLAGKAAMAWGWGNYWLLALQEKGWVEKMIPPSGEAKAIKANFFVTPTSVKAQFTNAWCMGIHSLSKNPDMAWEFIKILLSKENILKNTDAGLPARKSHWEELKLSVNPVYAIWEEAASRGRPMPATAYYGELADTIYDVLAKIVMEKKPIEETLKAAQDSWNAKYAG
jgi:multiple sugar transport system substrate-binding protein